MKYATRSQTSNTEPRTVNIIFDLIFRISESFRNWSNSTKNANPKTEIAMLKTLFLIKIFRNEYNSNITSTSPKNPLIKGLKWK
jgi:hypothetical protein